MTSRRFLLSICSCSVYAVRHAPSPPHASLSTRQSIACPCPRSVYCETTAHITFSFGGMVLGSSRKFKTFEEEGAGLLLGSALLSAAPSGGPSWARLSRRTERAVPHSAPNRPGKPEPGKEQQRHSDAASRCHRARRPASNAATTPPHPATARCTLELAPIDWPFSQRLARQAASPRGPAASAGHCAAFRSRQAPPCLWLAPATAGQPLSFPSAPPRRPAFNPPAAKPRSVRCGAAARHTEHRERTAESSRAAS